MSEKMDHEILREIAVNLMEGKDDIRAVAYLFFASDMLKQADVKELERKHYIEKYGPVWALMNPIPRPTQEDSVSRIDTRKIVDALKEAGRYTKTKPEVACEMMEEICDSIIGMFRFGDLGPAEAREQDVLARVHSNLLIGFAHVRSMPEMLDGYIYGACCELRLLEGRPLEEEDTHPAPAP